MATPAPTARIGYSGYRYQMNEPGITEEIPA